MKRDDYKKIIKENIGYNSLVKRCSTEELEEISVEELDGIVDLIVDVLTSEAEYMLVAGGTRPVADVKERFLSLNETHMAYPIFSVFPEPGLSPAILYFSCIKYCTSKYGNSISERFE